MDKLAQGIAEIAASQYPEPVIVRMVAVYRNAIAVKQQVAQAEAKLKNGLVSISIKAA